MRKRTLEEFYGFLANFERINKQSLQEDLKSGQGYQTQELNIQPLVLKIASRENYVWSLQDIFDMDETDLSYGGKIYLLLWYGLIPVKTVVHYHSLLIADVFDSLIKTEARVSTLLTNTIEPLLERLNKGQVVGFESRGIERDVIRALFRLDVFTRKEKRYLDLVNSVMQFDSFDTALQKYFLCFCEETGGLDLEKSKERAYHILVDLLTKENA